MAQQTHGCRKFLFFGCTGCLGLLVLLLIVCAVIFGIAWSDVRSEQVEKKKFERVLETPSEIAIADAPLAVPEEFVPSQRSGTVVLDIRNSVVTIRPGKPGEPLRVEAEFDVRSFELSESFSEDDETWAWEIGFRRISGSYGMSMLKRLLGGSGSEIEVFLPPDVPFQLEVEVLQGGADAELGGLWLTNADIRFLQGGGAVDFSKPLKVPIDSLGVEFSQGGGAIQGVANASPAVLEVCFSMGGGLLDLEGSWAQDAEISIDQTMGGVEVRLPKDVIIRGLGRYDTEMAQEGESEIPVLRFSTSSSMGELEFIR